MKPTQAPENLSDSNESFQPRRLCLRCLRPLPACYCAHVHPIETHPEFFILIHPLEARRPIATGRMAHRCLANSMRSVGVDFSRDETVESVLNDPGVQGHLLYPTRGGTDLTTLSKAERHTLFSPEKRHVIFVLDGTWATAKKMRKQSTNLHKLPAIQFMPTSPSSFRVRKQPKEFCYSTIEAIHHLLELLWEPGTPRPHDQLLHAFDSMVERQIDFLKLVGAHHPAVPPELRSKEAKVRGRRPLPLEVARDLSLQAEIASLS